MIVISDTSPITNLLQIGRLDLLHQVYDKVVIPPAVQHELYVLSSQAESLSALDWLEVAVVQDQNYVRKLTVVDGLDLGEAEAITLAIQEDADWLIVDESLGRSIADRHKIPIVGVLGVLIQAKRLGCVHEIRSDILRLMAIGFRISPALVNQILRAVGEPPL